MCWGNAEIPDRKPLTQKCFAAGALFRFEVRDRASAFVVDVWMKPLEPDGATEIAPLVRELCAFLAPGY